MTNKNIKLGTILSSSSNEYKILEEIGSGGFGCVYKVLNITDNNIYALKIITSACDKDLLKTEVGLAKKINNIHVVKYVDFFEGDEINYPFIVMDFIEGISLDTFLQNNNTLLDLELIVDLIKQLTDGMIAINDVIVHRDIKPKNIMVNSDKKIVICDFGISKSCEEETRHKTYKGYCTPRYASPEAILFQKNTIQMDMYSMGIVFYEIATLNYPYQVADDNEACIQAHLHEQIISPLNYNEAIPLYLVNIISKMLEKSPENRFANFREIEEEINMHENKIINTFVENMIKERCAYDVQIETKKRMIQEKQGKLRTKVDKIFSTFEKEIYNELELIVKSFNDNYPNGTIMISGGGSIEESGAEIVSLDGKTTLIEIRVLSYLLHSAGLVESVDPNLNEYTIPKLKGGNVVAWGKIVRDANKGINLYLVENMDNFEWYYSVTINAIFSIDYDKDTECLDYDEMEEELCRYNTFVSHNTTVYKMKNIEDILKYIDFCDI